MEVSPPTQPSTQSSETSLPEQSNDDDGTSLHHAMAPWALAAGVVSLLVVLVLVALMVAHRTKYAA